MSERKDKKMIHSLIDFFGKFHNKSTSNMMRVGDSKNYKQYPTDNNMQLQYSILMTARIHFLNPFSLE